jgi:hypothetical protein
LKQKEKKKVETIKKSFSLAEKLKKKLFQLLKKTALRLSTNVRPPAAPAARTAQAATNCCQGSH